MTTLWYASDNAISFLLKFLNDYTGFYIELLGSRSLDETFVIMKIDLHGNVEH